MTVCGKEATLTNDYRFIWHDGGRSEAGFTGHTGDCAARAIAIATGEEYKKVYDELTKRQGVSPRRGTVDFAYHEFLSSRGWTKQVSNFEFAERGVFIVELCGSRRDSSGHLCTLVDGVLYDTWDCLADDYVVLAHWLHPDHANTDGQTLPKVSIRCRQRAKHDAEFQRVLSRIKKLEATATNAAATEGEVENALRAMQAMLLKHNLTRADIAEEETSVDGFTNRAVRVNGKNACAWEGSLARYLADELFPLVSYYKDRKHKQTFYWFYGPVNDVELCIALYRELLLTIAAAATAQFGNCRRGKGASYAEGFVDGLPRNKHEYDDAETTPSSARQLIAAKSNEITIQAERWLFSECGIRLVSGYSSGRYSFDQGAYGQGKADGAKHNVGDLKPRLIEHKK